MEIFSIFLEPISVLRVDQSGAGELRRQQRRQFWGVVPHRAPRPKVESIALSSPAPLLHRVVSVPHRCDPAGASENSSLGTPLLKPVSDARAPRRGNHSRDGRGRPNSSNGRVLLRKEVTNIRQSVLAAGRHTETDESEPKRNEPEPASRPVKGTVGAAPDGAHLGEGAACRPVVCALPPGYCRASPPRCFPISERDQGKEGRKSLPLRPAPTISRRGPGCRVAKAGPSVCELRP